MSSFKIFQKVEEESERRAQEDASARIDAAQPPGPANTGSATVHRARNRRPGSISITRFGQVSCSRNMLPLLVNSIDSLPTPQRVLRAFPVPFASQQWLRSKPSIKRKLQYVSFTYACHRKSLTVALLPKNDSTNSFASGASAHYGDEAAHVEEDSHVTQMHQIAGRQSISKAVGGLLPRRLSRARSANVLSTSEANMVIGVSVEEATVESAEGAETSFTSVHAPGALRHQPSRLTMAGSSPARNKWVSKAKVFTQKFRRKDKPV